MSLAHEATTREQVEYIVWGVMTDSQEKLHEWNVMGVGFRFDDKADAQHFAEGAASPEAEKAQRATDGNVTSAIYLVPCPSGSMERDESKWERVHA